MNKERLQEIKDSIDFQREFLTASNMQTLCVDEEMELYNEIIRLQQENQQLKKERKSLMTVLNTSREKYNNDKARYRRKYKDLKKQKDDVVEYIKYQLRNLDFKKEEDMKAKMLGSMILVMLEDNRTLGEIDGNK